MIAVTASTPQPAETKAEFLVTAAEFLVIVDATADFATALGEFVAERLVAADRVAVSAVEIPVIAAAYPEASFAGYWHEYLLVGNLQKV